MATNAYQRERKAALGDYLERRGLVAPRPLEEIYESRAAKDLERYIYWPGGAEGVANSLSWATSLLANSFHPFPSNYLPLLPVDDLSFACVVCGTKDDPDTGVEEVRRWHLGQIPAPHQGALLDTDVRAYLDSLAEEMRARPSGLARVKKVAERYQQAYVETGTRPRGSVLRPIQLACQNVIIGLATLQHDRVFDGLRVVDYLTCEVPHVGAHEGDRAMLAMLLCDAFQNGGTMEVRFGGQGREERIPPAIARFCRTVDVAVGGEDQACISPEESRSLFLAVTPMPEELRMRCEDLFDRGILSPERLCFTLMAGVFTAIELDYIVATSGRAETILRGGSSDVTSAAGSAEIEVCRAALMVGMLQRCLDGQDSAGVDTNTVRVFEDGEQRVSWSVLDAVGAVMIDGAKGAMPWGLQTPGAHRADAFICIPRGLPIPPDVELVHELETMYPGAVVALVVPADMADVLPTETPVMICPDRLVDLDADIERRLTGLRVGRL
jgi:hypothetical protein